MSDNESLMDIGNFIILLVTGALIPLLLVVYKSRCSSICWGCIKREVMNDTDDDDERKPTLKEANDTARAEIRETNKEPVVTETEPAVEDNN